MIKTFLSPLSSLYSQLMSWRNSLYDSQTLAVSHLAVPVVSVGNITLGGTGKTPFVLGLITWAESQGLQCGVISRGYKSATQKPRRVDWAVPDAPHLFGDEPTLIAKKKPNTPVYVGAERYQVGQMLLAENNVQIILADDAFQHRRLHRNIDVVLVDALSDLKKEKVLPAGRLRESCSALKRADFVVITRANLVSEERLSALKEEILSFGVSKENLIEDRLEIKSCYELKYPDKTRRQIQVEQLPQPALLLSGIGQPKSFELLLNKYGVKFKKHFNFPDHHDFLDHDVEAIANSAEAQSARCVLTTEKDIIKLMELDLTNEDWARLPVFVVEVESAYSENIRKLHDAIISMAR